MCFARDVEFWPRSTSKKHHIRQRITRLYHILYHREQKTVTKWDRRMATSLHGLGRGAEFGVDMNQVDDLCGRAEECTKKGDIAGFGRK